MGPVISMVTGGMRDARALVARVGAAARAGIDLIQVREADLDDRSLVALVTGCLEAVRHTSTRVIVNDRIDVVLATGAHGVHLRGDSIPPLRARAIVPRGVLVGLSVHDRAEIACATEGGRVDYLVFGTVFPSASKPGRTPAGLEALARAVAATPIPVLAIGGMASARLPEVGATGAAGFAAISLFADVPIDTLAAVVAGARQAFGRERRVG